MYVTSLIPSGLRITYKGEGYRFLNLKREFLKANNDFKFLISVILHIIYRDSIKTY